MIELGAVKRYAPVRKAWGDVLASVFDPDGNIIGVVQKKFNKD